MKTSYWTVPSLLCSKKASIQTRAIYQVEDTRCIPCVTAGAGHYKENTSGQSSTGARKGAEIQARRQHGV